nr:MAG: MC029L [Molluscum contagiosum virus]
MQADGAAIYVSLSSLFDASFDFQLTVCHDYCERHALRVLHEERAHGTVREELLRSEAWERIRGLGVTHVVFFQLRQFGTSVAQLYALMQPTTMTLHFVRDCMTFDGGQSAPVFRIVPMDVSTALRARMRDFVALMHMRSCTRAMLRDFVLCNFGAFETLVQTLRRHVLIVTLELAQHEKAARHSLASSKKSKALSMLRFRAFMSKVRALRPLFESSALEGICDAMRCVSL